VWPPALALRVAARGLKPSKRGPEQGDHLAPAGLSPPSRRRSNFLKLGASGRLTRSRNLFGVFVVRSAKMGIEQLALQQE
jgi:hypothetical protein